MEQLVQVAKKKNRKIIVLISEQECKTWVLEILIHISDVCDLTCLSVQLSPMRPGLLAAIAFSLWQEG